MVTKLILLIASIATIVEAWTPIGSVYNLPSISNIKIADKEYVIWRKERYELVVQDNVCKHRLAPLSEGRITGNCIECGYHGWKYNDKGKCINIPQEDKFIENKEGYSIANYKTKVTGDILWACLDNKIDKIDKIDTDEVLMNSDVPYIREVPYSWNYLLENFFDPAHIPFAHHGMQSYRNDASSIPINLEKFNKDELVISFKDVTAGNKRHGKIVYKAPYIYKLYKQKSYKTQSDKTQSYKTQSDKDDWENDLTILCVPITAGRSRVFMCYDKRKQPKFMKDGMSESKMTESKMRKNAHVMSNKFFNTDDYLVHKQEINHRKGYKYNMPTESDEGIRILNRWLKRYYPDWIYSNSASAKTNARKNLIELSKEEALDNYNNHIKNCKDCKEYYDNLK